jgi:alpha-1,6-mannosyltransferase
MKRQWYIVFACIMEICYLSFYFTTGPDEILLFISVYAAAFILLSILIYHIRTQKGNARLTTGVPYIFVFALLFRLTLLAHDPVASDDIYRYVWDGRVAADGLNPFAYAPADAAVAHLQTETLPARINFPEMRTIYPPLAQWTFLLSHILFGPSVTGLKFLLVLADLISILLLIQLLRHYALPPTYVILYAWSPLPILYFALDGHVDALGIPFLLLMLLLLSRNRSIQAAFALGCAALAKVYPLFILPFLLKRKETIKERAVLMIPPLLFAAGCFIYLEPTGGLYESFGIFSSTWEFNGSLFKVMRWVFGSSTTARLLCAILFLAYVIWLSMGTRSVAEKIFLGLLGFFLLSPIVHPWYLSWLAAILVVRWSLALFVLLGSSILSNFVVYEYRLSGIWQESTMLVILEYLPCLALFAWECGRQRLHTTTAKVLSRS